MKPLQIVVRNILKIILAVQSERKIKFGGQQFAAPHVQGLCQAMDKECEEFA
jgi:hypothetical protein